MSIDFAKINRAHVYLKDQLAGTLKQDLKQGEYSFVYHKNYINSNALPIATSFPIRKEPYISKQLHPFFDNLILEGWLLGHAEKVLHISKINRFAMLMATGQCPLGAVCLQPLDYSNNQEIQLNIFEEFLGEQNLKNYPHKTLSQLKRCPSCFNTIAPQTIHLKCVKTLWGTTRNISIELDSQSPETAFARVIYGGSISGAQRKGVFRLTNKSILTPTAINAKYILKPSGNYPELPANEHVTMAIAKKVGFEVPSFSILNIDPLGLIFVIKRFDQHNSQPLMMEDMGQILKMNSSDKYTGSCEKVAKALVLFSSAPQIDLEIFYRRLVFCYFIANADMHLKNWSLIESYRDPGKYQLAPCYDLLNTRVAIPNESVDIALTILGKNKNLQGSYFKKFGQKIRLSERAIQKPFEDLQHWWTVTEDFVKHSLLSTKLKERYLDIVYKRYNILKSQ